MIGKEFKRKIISVVVFLLLFPFSFAGAVNPCYESSNGYITVGTWFYYNVTTSGGWYVTNITIFGMNDTHVMYTWDQTWYNGWRKVYSMSFNVNHGISFFWIDKERFLRYLTEVNETIRYGKLLQTFIVESNETFFNYKTCYTYTSLEVNETLQTEHWIWINSTYGIIEKHERVVKYFASILGRATRLVIGYERSVLLSWWSPEFAEKTKEYTQVNFKVLFYWFLLGVTVATAVIILWKKCKLLDSYLRFYRSK